MLELVRYAEPAAFYRRAEPFLLANEAAHNLILGLCAELVRNPNLYGAEPPYLALVERQGAVVAAALMTPPHRLILSQTEVPEAFALLADDLVAAFGRLPGVLGPKPHSADFAERWQRLTGQSHRLGMAERIYQLTAVRPADSVPGQLRQARATDHELLVAWFAGFSREALGQHDPAEAPAQVARWLAAEDRRLYLWEDGVPTTMVGTAGPTPHGIRIGAVYTPPERRRRGYASAAVAAVSQRQLDEGRRLCFLFTDLSNPTSNHIYQAVGYQPVCDMDEYHFD